MKVILVHEDNHGLIGIAKDYQSALAFLVKHDWLNGLCEFWDDENSEWVSIQNYFGDNWQTVLEELTLKDFNLLWEGCFTLEEAEVFGG